MTSVICPSGPGQVHVTVIHLPEAGQLHDVTVICQPGPGLVRYVTVQ